MKRIRLLLSILGFLGALSTIRGYKFSDVTLEDVEKKLNSLYSLTSDGSLRKTQRKFSELYDSFEDFGVPMSKEVLFLIVINSSVSSSVR